MGVLRLLEGEMVCTSLGVLEAEKGSESRIQEPPAGKDLTVHSRGSQASSPPNPAGV